MLFYTECFTGLEKLILIKLGIGGLILDLNQFSRLPQLPKNDTCFKSEQKKAQNNHLTLLVCSLHRVCHRLWHTLCRLPDQNLVNKCVAFLIWIISSSIFVLEKISLVSYFWKNCHIANINMGWNFSDV